MINLHNCETWFMLYADGELSAAERIVVEQFLEAHPGLRSAFDQLQALKFLPDDAVVFPDRFLLYQEQPAEEIGSESMSTENRYRFEPDLSVSFPNKHLLYRAESPVRRLEQAKGTKVVDNGAPARGLEQAPAKRVLGDDGSTVRLLNTGRRFWTRVGIGYVAAALTVSAIGLLWLFFSKDGTDMPLKQMAATSADRPEKITKESSKEIVEDTPHKTPEKTGVMVLGKTTKDNSKDNLKPNPKDKPKVNPKINPLFTTGTILAKGLENKSLVVDSDQSPNGTDEVKNERAMPEKKQRNDRPLNKTTGTALEGIQNAVKSTAQQGTLNRRKGIGQPGRVDTEGTYAERTVQVKTATTTSLELTMSRSNLSPATRALAAERLAAQESIAASGSSVTNTMLSSTALSSAVLFNTQDPSIAMEEIKTARPRTGLRRLLDKINATIQQELEYEEDKKYIQVASFKIPVPKEDKD